MIRFNRFSSRLLDWGQLSNKSSSGLVWSESWSELCSDSWGEVFGLGWNLSNLWLSFRVIISSSNFLSLCCKFLIVCLIWWISDCKSWSVISLFLFLNLSNVLDRLIIGLSNLGLLSECSNKAFNLSMYFCFKLGSSNLLIKSIRADSSWFCFVRTVICFTGVQQTSLHPNVIL